MELTLPIATHQTGLAPATIRQYIAQAHAWTRWATEHGVAAFPASAGDVVRYLEASGRSMSWRRVVVAMLGVAHHAAGAPNPAETFCVKASLRRFARIAPSPRQARPLTEADWQAAVAALDTSTPQGARDLAILGVMRGCLLRQSEVCALNADDIEDDVLIVRRSKTDQQGRGAALFVPTQARLALKAWMTWLPDRGAAVFRGVHRSGSILERLTTRSVSLILRRVCRKAGLPEDGISGHSPRVGMAQDLAEADIGLVEIQRAGRWRSPAMPGYYTRAASARRGAVARFYAEEKQDA